MSSNICQESKYHQPSRYDRQFYLTKGEKSKRFDALIPLVAHVLYSERKSFEYVRDVALARLKKTILDQLGLLALGDIYDYSDLEKLSKNIFHWGKKDFERRRKFKKTVWVEILKRQSTKKLLDGLKILTDLREIKTFVKIIFDILSDAKQTDLKAVEKLIWQPMEEAEFYTNILEFLDAEYYNLKLNFNDFKCKLNARFFNKQRPERQAVMRLREIDYLHAQAMEPIVIRYMINWYRGRADQFILKKYTKLKTEQDKINMLDHQMSLEQTCSTSTCDFLYAQANQLKVEIAALQQHYDTEIEAIENDINYTRIQLKKLADSRKFFTEEIAWFHEEIRQVLEEEERLRLEAEEKERLRLEEEAFLEMERLRLKKLRAKRAKKKDK